MTITFAIVSTKGGVGKTTEAANLGGICAEFGMRTLLLDGDVQPSLSRYYPLFYRAPFGLTAVITRGGSISVDYLTGSAKYVSRCSSAVADGASQVNSTHYGKSAHRADFAIMSSFSDWSDGLDHSRFVKWQLQSASADNFSDWRQDVFAPPLASCRFKVQQHH